MPFFIIAVIFASGCATVEEPSIDISYIQKQGIYHKVRQGETLWRIARTYDVPIDALVDSNKIPNVAHIEDGQLVFVPGATEAIEVGDPQRLNEFDWPINGKVFSYFGHRSALGLTNNGIDIIAEGGQAVCASRDGRVVFADYLTGYGHAVIVDHEDGYLTVYANNAELLVALDDFVLKGQPIARVGVDNTLAFLHFEIRKNEVADNPLYYLP